MRVLAVAALALVLAGCGGDARERGTATLWVTRDRGAHVIYDGEVPAGLTVLQAVDRELDVDTRYGGRFVQAIEGLEGDASKRRDWFWYVNGVEGDRSAAEYRLRAGEVAWWDYRSWKTRMRVPVVIGAWPEPFVHGYDGKRGTVIVTGVLTAATERAMAKLLRNVPRSRVRPGTKAYDNVIEIKRDARFHATGGPGHVYVEISPRDVVRLARDPSLARMRYEGLRG